VTDSSSAEPRIQAVLVDLGDGQPPLAVTPDEAFLAPGQDGRAEEVLGRRDSRLRRDLDAAPRPDGFVRFVAADAADEPEPVRRAVLTMQDVLALRAEGLEAQPNHVLVSHQVLGFPMKGFPMKGFPMKGFPMKGFPMKGFGAAGADGIIVGALTLSEPLTTCTGQPGNTWPSTRDAVATSTAEPVGDPGGAAPVFGAAGSITVLVLDTGLPDDTQRPPGLGRVTDDGAGDRVDVPDRDSNSVLDVQAGHGTFIAGLIGRLAPGCRVIVRQVLDGDGYGEEQRVASLLEEYAGQVDLVNLSMGTYTPIYPRLLEHAVRAIQSGIGAPQQAGDPPKPAVVVASAGNDSTWIPTYPAALPDVVSVAALDAEGPADYTNLGPWVRACAPGTDLVSSFFTSFTSVEQSEGGQVSRAFRGWARWSGTSFAAPVVVAALARAMRADGVPAPAAVQRVIDAPGLLRLPMLGTVVNIG
jgi:hypothetical protein